MFYEQAMLVDLRKVQMEKWGKKKLGGRRKRDGADVTDKKKTNNFFFLFLFLTNRENEYTIENKVGILAEEPRMTS